TAGRSRRGARCWRCCARWAIARSRRPPPCLACRCKKPTGTPDDQLREPTRGHGWACPPLRLPVTLLLLVTGGPMRIFISAGEPSGALHGANLIRALRQTDPGVECVGFGGEQMEAAGCRLLYPLVHLAVMWFVRVLLNAHQFIRLLVQADRYFRDHRPD